MLLVVFELIVLFNACSEHQLTVPLLNRRPSISSAT
jgi:hypothetical protein